MFLLLGFLAASCSESNEVSSYQKTTEPNGIVPFGNELQNASNENDPSTNLFEGFATEQNSPDSQQNIPAPNNDRQAAAPGETLVRSETPTNSAQPNATTPAPAPAAPKPTAKATSTTLNPVTTQTPLLPVTFKSAGSYIWLSSTTNSPALVIQVTANCPRGEEYFVEASVFQNGSSLLTSSGSTTCAASLAYFKSIPIDYVEGARYSINYRISQNGKTLAETSAPTVIRL